MRMDVVDADVTTDADVADSVCVQDLDNFCVSLLSHNALLIHYQTHNSHYSNQTTMKC